MGRLCAQHRFKHITGCHVLPVSQCVQRSTNARFTRTRKTSRANLNLTRSAATMSGKYRALISTNVLHLDRGWLTGGSSGTIITQTPQQPPSDNLDPPYHETRMSQLPMNLACDDSGDDRTIDGASNSGSTTDSVRSFESIRDMHELIREFNGRYYNAQNPGQFESESLILPRFLSHLPVPFPEGSVTHDLFHLSR